MKKTKIYAIGKRVCLLISTLVMSVGLCIGQAQGLEFDTNTKHMIVTPHTHHLLVSYAVDRYSTDFSITSAEEPGVQSCSNYCPTSALAAGAVYYREFNVTGHGTITVYYDISAAIVGTSPDNDLDDDGIPNDQDNDRDGDGMENIFDAYPDDTGRRFIGDIEVCVLA